MADNSDISYFIVLLTVVVCLYAEPLSRRLGVLDVPDGERKSHPLPTPMVGGIAIMLPLCAWCAIVYLRGAAAPASDLCLTILICGGGLAVVGFMDDQRTISATARLLLLAILSVLALRLDPMLVTNRVFTAYGGWSTVATGVIPALTVLAFMGFTSAVNMADGMNGIVMTLYLIWAFCLTWLSGGVGGGLAGGVAGGAAQIVAAAAFITFMFNLRGRLFLGDCGTFAVAFVIGVLTVLCHNAGRLPLETVVVWFFIPVADCLRLIVLRTWQGRSPFRPDKRHFHHQLARWIGWSGAFWTYGGFVAVTSLVATTLPRLADVCIAVSAVFYVGFQAADALAPSRAVAAVGNADGAAETSATVISFMRRRKR